MPPPLRVRENDTRASRSVAVGQNYAYDPSGLKPTRWGSIIKVAQTTGVYEIVMDENHGRPPYRTGGPFFLGRENFTTPVVASGDYKPTGVSSTGDNFRTAYTGGFVLNQWPSLPSLGSLPRKSTTYQTDLNPDDLQNLGNKAYNRLRPKVEKANLFQFFYELKEAPQMMGQSALAFANAEKAIVPLQEAIRLAGEGRKNFRSIKKSAIQMSKQTSGHFLNHVFGWAPFVKDVDDMLKLVDNYYTELAKAEKANGEWVHRRRTEPDIVSDVEVWNTTYAISHISHRHSFVPAINGCVSSSMRVRRVKSTQVWYEGRFRQYRPEFDRGVAMHDQVRSARAFLSLAGAKISPIVLWKITPWSWLADWFSNLGGNIQAVQDYLTGEVTSSYMYIMRYTRDSYIYAGYQQMSNGPDLSGSSARYREVKRREPASSPFGFTLSGELSPVQQLILAALASSK